MGQFAEPQRNQKMINCISSVIQSMFEGIFKLKKKTKKKKKNVKIVEKLDES